MLHPESQSASAIAWLWWLLFSICSIVFVVVVTLTIVAVVVRRSDTRATPTLGNRFIIVNGAIIPACILIVILIASLSGQVALRDPETALTIRVTGHMWWWEVAYPREQIVVANEIHIPVGEPVRLELASGDVIHSLWVPNLQGKTDLIPDKLNTMWLAADRPGIYRGQCAEYCGIQHALMGIRVIALPRQEFDAWISQRQQARAPLPSDDRQRGRQVFVEAKCNNCHVIGQSVALGKRGPDLTHLGARHTLAAGLMPNSADNLAAWIIDPQHLKPGSLMPATRLNADDLQDLVEYLQSLQ